MRLRALGAALLNDIIAILIISTVAAVAAIFAWTGINLPGILISVAVVLLAMAAVAMKGHSVYTQSVAQSQLIAFRRAEVRRLLSTRSPSEKEVLRYLLFKGQLTESQINERLHAVSLPVTNLPTLAHATGLLRTEFTGYWVILPEFADILREEIGTTV
jgi:hypothetical protein